MVACSAACQAVDGAPDTSLQVASLLHSSTATSLGALAVAFLAGRVSVRAGKRQRQPQVNKSDWLDDLAMSTRGAAVVYALTSCGLMDVLPLPGEPCLPAPLLAQHCGMSGGGAGGELRRLLCFLASFGIVEVQHPEHGEAAFRHTARSLELRSGGKAHAFALVHLSPTHVRPWWRITDALTTPAGLLPSRGQFDAEEVGEPFRLEHGGRGAFEFYADPSNAELARHFDALMRQLSAGTARSSAAASSELIAGLPLWDELLAAQGRQDRGRGAELPAVVDVGGGAGHVLAALLARHSGLRGVLFDRPDVVSAHAVVPELNGALAARASLVGGDFFRASNLPGDAGVFMLKWILHDWSDAKCRRILQGIRAAVSSEAGQGMVGARRRPRLLLIEEVVPEVSDQSEAAKAARRNYNDTDMWVIFGGRERTVAEYSALLREEGFAPCRVTYLDGFNMVAIEAEVVPVINYMELEAVSQRDAMATCQA